MVLAICVRRVSCGSPQRDGVRPLRGRHNRSCCREEFCQHYFGHEGTECSWSGKKASPEVPDMSDWMPICSMNPFALYANVLRTIMQPCEYVADCNNQVM